MVGPGEAIIGTRKVTFTATDARIAVDIAATVVAGHEQIRRGSVSESHG